MNEFAGGLDHPRYLLTLANGDLLVAESDSPGTDKTGGTIKGTIQKMLMKMAKSGKGSPNRIMLLRDADGDGVAEARSVLLDHELHSPFGMAVIGGELFVANANALVAFPFTAGQPTITAKPRVVTELPSGYNHHWTKSLVASPDGRILYVGIGSNSNVGENGLEMEKGRAAIWKIDPTSGAYAIMAGGLRNPVGIAFNPAGDALWAVVNERDELGNDLVPDYLTLVKQGAFYGWPFSY
ncbi:MAG: PQQ-dependent sugar dehydrogenase [Sphingomonas bacterium]|nr:PQQ-dependent sugar dehydrogenase [Sphingomonas bacterium]